MKVKQHWLTGILALTIVIGASAHDKGTTARKAVSPSETYEIEMPATNMEISTSIASDLKGVEQALTAQRQRKLAALLLVKQDDIRMTESAAADLVGVIPASVEQLVERQQEEALLTSWKQEAAAVTEAAR